VLELEGVIGVIYRAGKKRIDGRDKGKKGGIIRVVRNRVDARLYDSGCYLISLY